MMIETGRMPFRFCLTRSQMFYADGGRLPWWGGVAWSRQNSMTFVVLPLGLHWIAGWLRRAWREFRSGYHGESWVDQQVHISVECERQRCASVWSTQVKSSEDRASRAYEHGWKQGQEAMIEHVKQIARDVLAP